jgi:hypothetical protein
MNAKTHHTAPRRSPLPMAVLLALPIACGGGSGPPDQHDLSALFAERCSGGLCHVDSQAPAENLDLSPDVLCDQLVGVPSAQAPDELRVVPGDPASSYLLCKLDPACQGRAAGTWLMPPGGELSPADIALVSAWIADGAPGCAAADEVPPDFAGAAAATGLASGIRIEWSPASDDTAAPGDITYLIYAAEAPGAQDFSAPSHTTQPGAGSFVVSPLPVLATRYYVVRARDSAGNIDGNTVEVSATTLEFADELPPVFEGVQQASTGSSTSVLLSWSPAIDDVSPAELIRYRAYSATVSGGQDFASAAAESLPGDTELLVTALSPETMYHFVVRAVDAVGNEDSNVIERSAATSGGASFSADVQPILTASCASAACHTGFMPAEGLRLDEGVAYGELVGVISSQCAGRALVAPGAPESSYLVDKLRGINLCSGTRMPKSGPLPAAQIQTMVDWIAQGAPEN